MLRGLWPISGKQVEEEHWIKKGQIVAPQQGEKQHQPKLRDNALNIQGKDISWLGDRFTERNTQKVFVSSCWSLVETSIF